MKLKDKIFILTGSFPGHKRKWKDLIEENGGTVKKSICRDADYLLVGYEPGNKLQKAQELNIKIIDIDELEEMIK